MTVEHRNFLCALRSFFRVPHWQYGCQRFESAMLHQNKKGPNTNLKYKYGSRHFWCRGYYVDTVERHKKAIVEYIKNQLQEDIASDQISFKEYIDPFTGSKNIKA